MLPLKVSLGRFSTRDIEKLNHASELMAATVNAIRQTNLSARDAVIQLLYEANQEVLGVMSKPVENMKRWHRRAGLPVPGEGQGGEPSQSG